MTAPPLALPHPPSSSPPLLRVKSLRTQLEAVVAGGRAAGIPWATGITPLDAALGGGIPRGRITEVVGTLASGKTALLRQVVSRVLRTGGWVAWIDARRTLAAAPWAGLGERLVMVRPRDGKRSAWCADLLLRSGVFALVVIDGAPALSRVHGVRLAQLARERDAACVVLQHEARPSRVSGAVRLRLEPMSAKPLPLRRQRTETQNIIRGFSVVVEKGGPSRSVRSIEVSSGIVMARRVCTDSEIPDRRGVARGTRRPRAAVGGSTDDAIGHPITWGGLGVSAHDDIHTPATTHRDTTRPGVRGADEHQYAPPLTPRERSRERERFDRTFDKHTRDWTRYRGRKRAGESSYGKPSKRERAREKIGVAIGYHSARYPGAPPALGRVAEGARR
ncbi:MAG: hypothetical protein IPP90_23755 [Gemmatimonadaceae bacterium]|nr:hypothetical protein [Gemmatimonadaceae bacterium]